MTEVGTTLEHCDIETSLQCPDSALSLLTSKWRSSPFEMYNVVHVRWEGAALHVTV